MPALGHRDPYKEQHWRETIARQKLSGLSKAQFCLGEAIKPAAFSNWERTIRFRDEQKRQSHGKSKRQQESRKKSGAQSKPSSGYAPHPRDKATFVKATVSEPHDSSPNTTTIEIVLPSGVVVRVPASFDLKILVRIMDALR